MFKRGFTFWNILAITIGVIVAAVSPGLFPAKHPARSVDNSARR
jgi:hypothetical protein